MQHEMLLVGALQGVDELLVLAGAKRRDHEPWVSPRVNSALPCARGSTPTSQ